MHQTTDNCDCSRL